MRIQVLSAITQVAVIFLLSSIVSAQSGGTFLIEKNVIAGGGGQSTGGTFTVNGTIGQPLAGTTSGGGTFIVESGFWTSSPLSLSGTITYGNAATPPRFISNVTLTGAGSPGVATTSSFPDGTYFLSGFGSGAYTVTPTKVGGVNGIASLDAARISQHVAGPPNPQLNATQLIVADVSGNTTVSSFDAAMIAKFVAGPPYAPPGIGSTGTWRFTPTNRAYASIAGSVAGEDYVGLLMGEVSGNWNNTGARPVESEGPDREITVRLANVVTPADKDIIVPINIEGAVNKSLISYELELRYDPAVIQPQAESVILAGTQSRNLLAVTNAIQPGILRVVVYGPKPIAADGVLLNLKFTAVGEKGSTSPLTVERMVFNEGENRVNTVSGKVEFF